MNVQDIFNRVKRSFGDESGVQISDDDLIRWINDAQVQIATENPSSMEAVATTNIVGGQSEYPQPADVNNIRALMFKGYRLKPLSFQEFNEYLDGFSAPAGSEYGYSSPRVFMVYAGNIVVFPTPSDPEENALKIYYSKLPAKVANTADELTVPERYHNAVVEYCLSRAYELDEDFEKASYKKTEFGDSVMKASVSESWNPQEYYPRITVLPEDENYGSSGYWGTV